MRQAPIVRRVPPDQRLVTWPSRGEFSADPAFRDQVSDEIALSPQVYGVKPSTYGLLFFLPAFASFAGDGRYSITGWLRSR